MKKLFLSVLMAFLVSSASMPVTVLADDSVDSTAGSQLGSDIDNLIAQKGYSGTLLVIQDGKPVYLTSRGYADFSAGTYNNKDTAYEIDSVQKVMTAAMIMKLVQENKLSLSDKLSKFYPEVPNSQNISIRQMLDMTSGLTMGDAGPNQVLSDPDIIKADISKIHFLRLYYNKWNYQPINFNLLSGILEQVTGKSYEKLFEETYVKKLKLKHTIFAYNQRSGLLKATGYNNIDPLSSKLDYKNAFDYKKYFEYDELGTGQVYMSAYDLYKTEKYIATGSMLSEKSRETLFTPGSSSTYGGGMYHLKNDNFANGWGYGYQAVVHLSDDGNNAVISLQNYSRTAADAKPMVSQIYKMVQTEKY